MDDEGRRFHALDLAVASSERGTHHETVLMRAKEFEKFLKGPGVKITNG